MAAAPDIDDCLQRIPVWGRQLAQGDELAQHRAVRELIACEAQAPVAFAAAPGLDTVTRGIERSAIARDKLSRELDRLGPSLGGALLAAILLPAADALLAAQRWYDDAGRWGSENGALAFAEQVAAAVKRAATNAQLRVPAASDEERRDAGFAAEALYNLVLRDSGVALQPPPETPAQVQIRQACGVTLAELRDMLATTGGSP